MRCLEEIKVLDMTQFLSASYCAQILGDLGAEVIKIEAPGKGEVYRTYGPKFINGESTSYLAINRNKKSLALNIKAPAAKEIMAKLVRDADVLVENFRVGTLKKYGFDYETLHKINPRLVYCSVSGFGQDGPYAKRGGFDLTAQAMAGLMYVTGEQDGPPVKVGYPIADIGGGLYAAIGILAALMGRQQTGQGQQVDASLFESTVAWGMMAGLNYFADGSIQGRMGSASPQNAPYQAFTVKDGAFTVGTGNDALWVKFCEVFQITHLLAKPEYQNNALRVANQKALAADIEQALAELTVEECISRLDGVGIPCGKINSIAQVLQDPHVKERGLIWQFKHPVAGEVPNLGFPVHFSETPCSVRYYPPLLGEHSAQVLQGLGYTAEQVAQLADEGAIGVLEK